MRGKRCFQTLFGMTRGILYYVRLQNNQWREAISMKGYLNNQSITKLLIWIMHNEADTDTTPDLSNLHRFRCIAYHYDKNPQKKNNCN